MIANNESQGLGNLHVCVRSARDIEMLGHENDVWYDIDRIG